MDQQTAKRIHHELQAAIAAVLAANGYEQTRTHLRYGDSDFKFTLEGNLAGVDRRAQSFEAYAGSYGLPPDGLGKLFIQGGNVFEVVGLETKNRRYPLIARKHSDGKTYKMPITDRIIDQLLNPAPELAR